MTNNFRYFETRIPNKTVRDKTLIMNHFSVLIFEGED